MNRQYSILEHPADIGIEAFGSTPIEAFEAAGEGFYSIMFEQENIETSEMKQIDVESSDLESLLVKWLNEFIYLFETIEFIGKRIKIIEIVSEKNILKLSSQVFGEIYDKSKHIYKVGIKAITYHQLEVRTSSQGTILKVFFDI